MRFPCIGLCAGHARFRKSSLLIVVQSMDRFLPLLGLKLFLYRHFLRLPNVALGKILFLALAIAKYMAWPLLLTNLPAHMMMRRCMTLYVTILEGQPVATEGATITSTGAIPSKTLFRLCAPIRGVRLALLRALFQKECGMLTGTIFRWKNVPLALPLSVRGHFSRVVCM